MGKWWIQRAVRRPSSWALWGAALALAPLAALLGPFRHAELNPAWNLARDWAPFVGMLGASTALVFLTQSAEVLSHAAGRTQGSRVDRTAAELGTLLLASITPQAFLVAGAALAEPTGVVRLPSLALEGLLADLHTAALSVLALRVAAPAAVRVALVWGVAFGVPVLAAGSAWTIVVDPHAWYGVTSTSGDSPLTIASGLLLLASLLLLGASTPPPRTAPGLR